jgi:hypothetical protein
MGTAAGHAREDGVTGHYSDIVAAICESVYNMGCKGLCTLHSNKTASCGRVAGTVYFGLENAYFVD